MIRSQLSKSCTTLVLTLGLLGFVAGPALAQTTIQSGLDVWETPGDGSTLANLDIPAGFFCQGSAPIFTVIPMKGVPLATNPPGILGTADTVIERLKDVDLAPGECQPVPTVVRSLSLEGLDVVSVVCPSTGQVTTWKVSACTCSSCCAVQPITELKLCLDDPDCGCGTADGELSIDVCLNFTEVNTGAVLGPVTQRVNLAINGMPWCDKGLAGGLNVKQAFQVDTNCDSKADLAVPCTSNFFPGMTCDNQGKSCLDLHGDLTTCHNNPNPADKHDHCVNPVCDRKQ